MKTGNLEKTLVGLACAFLVLSASVALAQNYSTTTTAQPAAVNASGPQMVYGVPQIIRLSQAKVSDDTIIAYIKNSRNSYGLTADQIIYLKQQGVSDAVITTMLNQPKSEPVAYTPATPAPQLVASSVNTSTPETRPLYSPRQSDQIPPASVSAQPVPAATVAPTVTYVQAAPVPAYYYYAQPSYYPYYSWFPPVSLSFAWGGGWRGGGYGGWHGGGYGGWHH